MDENGSGIITPGMPAMKEGSHGFQLWINMPASLKMSKPEYHYIDANEMSMHHDEDKKIKVIAGKFENAEGPIKSIMLSQYSLMLNLNKINSLVFQYLMHNRFIYLVDGRIKSVIFS